jgi:hypothetical protein
MGSTEKVTTGLEMAAGDAGAGSFGQGTILNRVAARAYRRTPDQPCADCLDHSLAAGHRRPAVPRRVAFWLVALILTVTMLGTTLPTPLYVIYQAQWHFSAVIVTVTFAVYAAGVLTALLLAGRSSDQAGRKPVLAVALGASALSTIVFILTSGPCWPCPSCSPPCACSPWSASGAPSCRLGGRRRQALTTHPGTPSRTAHILKEVKRRVLPA